MKSLLTAIAVGLAALVMAPSSGVAAAYGSSHEHYGRARLTIPVLGIYNKPIVNDPAKGPIWDWKYPARPGDGKTMVIDSHDVTSVPGYGAHGPFYNMPVMKPGDKASIRWHGVTSVYKFVTKPFAYWQCLGRTNAIEEARSKNKGRYDGSYVCTPNNKPIKNWGMEVLYIRCCWPRYTDWKYHYMRAVLIRRK